MSIGNPVSLTGNIASKSISVTATAGQTLFTVTGGYRINQISVFRNGSRLVDSLDYTARDGASVTLLSAATLGDVIEFQVFDTFRAADALDVNSGGSVNGNVNASGIITAVGGFNIGIQSAGTTVTSGPVSTLNFVGTGNTFAISGTRVDISISGGGGSIGTTGITTQTFFSNPNIISTASTLNNPNHNYGMFGPVSIGATITVGVGNTFVII